jgi:hypothetical protein
MSDPKHKDERFSVLNPRNHAIVADPVSPKFAEAIALQRLTDRTRIIKRSDPIAKETENARDGLWIEPIEFARCCALELNPPRHDAG